MTSIPPDRGGGCRAVASAGRPRPPGRRSLARAVLPALLLASATAPAGAAEEVPAPPVVLHLAAPPRLAVGTAGTLRVVYRAPRADVVAVVVETEDLEGLRRATRQHEYNVLARAYGREAGDLVAPLSFTTPGRKRVTVTLVTEDRTASDPAVVEMDATP